MAGLGTNNPFRKRVSMPPPAVPGSQPQFVTDHSAPSLFDPYTSHLSGHSVDSTVRTSPTSIVHSFVGNTGANRTMEDGTSPSDTPNSPKGARPDPPKRRSFKKVQIQTPPPLSPCSPEDSSTSSEDDEEGEDPFSRDQIGQDGEPSLRGGLPGTQADLDPSGGNNASQPPPAGPPHNPFAKTLHSMERGGKEEHEKDASASKTPRASMDVDAFKRLLLTGYAGLEGQRRNSDPPTAAAAIPQVSTDSVETFRAKSRTSARLQANPESASTTTDASRQSSLFDAIPESPSAATAHEPEEEGPLAALPAPPRKKQPPPAPASRHGKLIKIELGKDQVPREKEAGDIGTDARDRIKPRLHRSPSDINKPLPPQPMPITFDDSPFDHEAAGRLPEPVEKEPHVAMLQAQSPDPVAIAPADATSAKPQPPAAAKRAPAPVPPPRRHARGESKVLTAPFVNHTPTHGTLSPSLMAEDGQQVALPGARRTSVESNRSMTMKSQAPAPPPPRRPHHQSRSSIGSISLASPGHLGSPSTVSLPSPHANIAPDVASIHSVSSEATPVPRHHSKHSISTLSPIQPSRTFPISPASPAGEGRDPLVHNRSSIKPPPPPPTRNPSTRRPPSVSSFDLGTVPRKTSRESAGGGALGPPPPPPKRGTRNRGDSKGSDSTVGGGCMGRRESIDVKDTVLEEAAPSVASVLADGEVVAAKAKTDGVSTATVVDVDGGKQSHANEILADLNALQREVDALRGRYEQVGHAVGGAVGGAGATGEGG